MDNNIKKLFEFTLSADKLPVILCIGSPNVIGDGFGPLTGQLLCDFFQIPTFVYGTVLHPVTALNLTDMLSFIKARHTSRKIIAVDSAVGKASDRELKFFYGPIKPGMASGKTLLEVGDFSVIATLGNAGVSSLFSVRLSEVYRRAHCAASAISDAVKQAQASRSDRAVSIL